MAGIDVEQRHRNLGRAERFFGEAEEADGILAAGKEQRGALEFAGDFAHHVDGFGLKVLKVVEVVVAHGKAESSELRV